MHFITKYPLLNFQILAKRTRNAAALSAINGIIKAVEDCLRPKNQHQKGNPCSLTVSDVSEFQKCEIATAREGKKRMKQHVPLGGKKSSVLQQSQKVD